MNLRFLLIIIFLLTFTTLVQSANEPVKATGEKIWGDNKKDITFIEGNVQIIQGSTRIFTEKAKVDTEKKVAVFEEKVKLNHPDVTIEADSLEYNFKKKVGTFSKNIILDRAEVKDELGKVTKDAFQLTATELYFESDTKNFTAKKDGSVSHKDFTGTADIIEYNDKNQELLFKGHAYLKRPNEEKINGEEIKINTQTKSFIVNKEIKLVNDDVTINGSRLDYDYQQKKGVFQDNVILERAESKDEHGKITKEYFKLTTTELFFDSDTKNFSTKTKGTVEHKDFTGSADRIEYNNDREELVFNKNAHLTRPKGEEINGDLITIMIHDKSFIVTENVNINFNVEAEKEERKTGRKR